MNNLRQLTLEAHTRAERKSFAGKLVKGQLDAKNYGPANEAEVTKNANRASKNQDRQVVEAINAIIITVMNQGESANKV